MLNFAKVRDQLADLLNRAEYRKERTIVTRRNKKVAAIVPIEDLELLEKLEDTADLEDVRKALDEIAEKGTVSWDDLKKDLKLEL